MLIGDDLETIQLKPAGQCHGKRSAPLMASDRSKVSLPTPNKLFALTSSKGGSSLFYRDIVRSKRGQMHDLFFSGLRPRQFPGNAALPHDEDAVGKG